MTVNIISGGSICFVHTIAVKNYVFVVYPSPYLVFIDLGSGKLRYNFSI